MPLISCKSKSSIAHLTRVNTSKTFFSRRFSSLLVSVPPAFKIVVLLLTSIDFNNTAAIRSDVLNGYYVRFDQYSEIIFYP